MREIDSLYFIIVVLDLVPFYRLLQIRSDVPDLRKIVQIQGEIQTEDPDVISWPELISFGEEIPDSLQLVSRLQDLAINKCCTLVYTSGTTGNPKGKAPLRYFTLSSCNSKSADRSSSHISQSKQRNSKCNSRNNNNNCKQCN